MTIEELQMKFAELLPQRQTEFDALPARDDRPGQWTVRQLEADEGRRSWLEGYLRSARRELATLAKLEPRIAADTKWVADLKTCRRKCVDAVLAASPATTDLERGRIQNLLVSIQVIDRGKHAAEESGWALETIHLGALLCELGYVAAPPIENQATGPLPWYGSVVVAEERLKELLAQRDDAQARLNAMLREPEPVAP